MGPSKKQRYWIGFDLGGTKMLAGIFDDNGKLLATERKKTKGQEGAAAGVDRILKTIRGAIGKAGIPADAIGGIGVGSPGPLDLARGVILDTPNMGWKNVPLKRKLETAFACPAAIGNDVDIGTYGEYRHGAARGGRCVLGIFPGTGIGGACIYEGRILTGGKRSCMEIGHLKADPGGRRCGCGRYGCLETVASRLAISADAAAAVYRGEAPKLAALAGTDLANIRSGILAQAIAEGDTVIEDIVRRAARRIGEAAANAINLLAPDFVVLGGGLSEAMPEIFRTEVTRGAEAQVMPAYAGTFKVRLAGLGDDAGITGGAALAADLFGGKAG